MRPDTVADLAFWVRSTSDGVVLTGSTVATWIDQSGAGHNLSASGVNQPLYVADAGDGGPALQFIGAPGGFDRRAGIVSTAGAFSFLIYLQVRPNAGTLLVQEVPLALAAATGPASLALHVDLRMRDAIEVRYYASNGQEVDPPASRATVALNTWIPVLIRYPSDGTIKMRAGFDDADVTLSTGGPNGADGLVVGADFIGGGPQGSFTGLIREVIGFSRAITDVEWSGLLEWMTAAGGSTDITTPVISNVSPTPGTAIAATQRLSVDVTDDSGLFRRVYLLARFPATGVVEVIHDGDGFTGLYTAGSSRTVIAKGFHYVVGRRGGWPSAPTITVDPIDTNGNEA